MSTNLAVDQVNEYQNFKEPTINAATGQLDAAITEAFEAEVDDSNAFTLSNEEFRRHVFFRVTDGSPAPTAAITLTCPAISRGVFVVLNETSYGVTVEISGQAEASPEVASGEIDVFVCDELNVRSTHGESGIYDLTRFHPGTPTAGAIVAGWIAVRGFTVPAGMTGSRWRCGTAPSSQVDFDVQLEGVGVGTITFAASATDATFTMASDTAVADGEEFDVVAPANLYGLADLRGTIKCRR